jgi:hypothetical protein
VIEVIARVSHAEMVNSVGIAGNGKGFPRQLGPAQVTSAALRDRLFPRRGSPLTAILWAVSDTSGGGGAAIGVASATVSYADRRLEVTNEEALTFGRSSACTICLDPTDRGISRLAGSIEHDSGSWWLHNRSTSRTLLAVDDLGIRSVVAPGRRTTVDGHLTVVVEGSARRHALEVNVGRRAESRAAVAGGFAGDEVPTAAGGEVLVNSLDRLALVALFSGYLEPFPRYDPHPKSYADAAALLAWPRTTLVKRIEHLRARLTSAGIPNLVGSDALDHLAEWALTTRVLTREDLELIGGPANRGRR